MSDTGMTPADEVPTHPEEIKAVYDLRIGESISLQGSARITPAGIVTAGLTVCAIMLTLGYVAARMPVRPRR
jgi:hypothetical protein